MLLFAVKQSLVITAFVLVMMMIIEYINIRSKGSLQKNLGKSVWKQIFTAALLGIIPGCLGTYTVVTMYTHNLLGFAALTTAMIATFGDEAFFMFSVIPDKALLLSVIVFIIAIISGFALQLIVKNRLYFSKHELHFTIHEEDTDCVSYSIKDMLAQLRNLSFQRTLVIVGLAGFLIALILGEVGHEHNFMIIDDHGHDHAHDHAHAHEGEGFWNWFNITFLIVSLAALYISLTVTDHFLEKHLWDHIIKKHFLKIFLITLVTLIVVHYIKEYIDIETLISDNIYLVLLIAVVIGIIPESGPHFIFILLFADGMIPFSILLASSIVQDGHGALPLLAESRKSFLLVKGINIIIGLAVGAIGILSGF